LPRYPANGMEREQRVVQEFQERVLNVACQTTWIMRHNPHHANDDPEVVRRMIRENPWGILVSRNRDELVASHYPILLDEQADGLAVVTHVGRPDEMLHGFGEREVLLIIQGRHGYISPSWYAPGATRAPTWNFSAAHCYGVPQILEEEENLAVLARLVAHFERHVEEPMLLDPEWGRPVARGTVGVRLPISRFVCKVKMSQDKDPVTQRQVIAALRSTGPYMNPELADDMGRALAGD
jgi:transcriptional regulator